jgi:V/A-type H+/Na+-transporting ATPase subunit E
MDIQLQELLEKIKHEGVEAAEQEASRIAAEAESSKKALLEAAEKEAALIVLRARSEAAKVEATSTAALAQASRDLLLSFKDRLEALLSDLVKEETKSAFGPEVLKDTIPLAIKALAESSGDTDLILLLPPASREALEKHFQSDFAALIKRGVEVRPYADLDSGFRLASKDGSAYYDFSAETLAELFSKHLNSRLAEIVRSAAKGM